MTMYFPPAGGGGVARPTKLATHLPELGIETHVLAPDDSKWLYRDEEAAIPPEAHVHRAKYVGPRGRLPAEELHGLEGFDRLLRQAALFSRRLLVPDEFVSWALTAIPAARRIVLDEDIDVLVTTSPPASVNLIGAAVTRATGVPWVADLRDSVAANPDRRTDSLAVQVKEQAQALVARLVASHADAVVTVSQAISEEMRELGAKRVETIPNGCDFEDFEGLEYHSGDRFRITHTGTFFGHRDPRPFLTALSETEDDVVARFVGGLRSSDREFADGLGLGERVEEIEHVPRRSALELQRDSEALLLLLARRGRPRTHRAVGEDLRVPRGRAADPRGSAAGRCRGRARAQRSRGRGRRSRRRARHEGGDRRTACPLAARRAREREASRRS